MILNDCTIINQLREVLVLRQRISDSDNILPSMKEGGSLQKNGQKGRGRGEGRGKEGTGRGSGGRRYREV